MNLSYATIRQLKEAQKFAKLKQETRVSETDNLALRRSLIGHWPLDEGTGRVARDRSGNGLDGAIHGATWCEGRSGGSALEFDPRGTRIEIPCDPLLDITEDLTISTWVWKRVPNDWKRWDAVVTRGPSVYVEPLQIHFELMISQANSDESSFFSGTAIPPAAWSGRQIPTQQWTHIAYVRKGDFGQFYLNGAPTNRLRVQVGYDPGHIGEGEGFLVTNVEMKGAMLPTAAGMPLLIGWDGNEGHGMDGRISDVYLYDRALSDDEVASLSQHGIVENT